MDYRFFILKKGCRSARQNDPVYVVIMLCARSGNEHITMIGELAEIFSDQQKLHRLLNADDSKAIQAVID
jgi:PTS system ascorbate-specific IIA component